MALTQVSTGGIKDGTIVDADINASAAISASKVNVPATIIAENKQVIDQNYSLSTGFNGASVGPVEVAATYAVTVPANTTWVVI